MTPFAGISHELRRNFADVAQEVFAPRVRASRPVPNPSPFSPPPAPLSMRDSVLPMDMLSSSVLNSQFLAPIFNLAQKLAAMAPFGGLHFKMGGERWR